jgi:2-succinyl-6-hydroxy-2,4-cyclohexadiene-1-carboxylate synthase
MLSILNYKQFGEGETVVFLHGFLESISMWEKLSLESIHFQSILIDLPGHGESKNEDNSQVPSIDYMANRVIETLNQLGIKKYHVVGHSMGGYVALVLKKIDVRCEKVILLNSNFWEDSAEKQKDRIRVADIVFKNKNLFLKEAIPNLYNDQVKYKEEITALLSEALKMEAFSIAYASLAMSKRLDFSELIIHKPSDFVIVQGEIDAIVPRLIMESKEALKKVPYYLIKNTGHMSHFENPSEIHQLLIKELGSLERN